MLSLCGVVREYHGRAQLRTAKQGGVGVGADHVLRSVAVRSWRFDRGVTCVSGGVVRICFFLVFFLVLFWEEGGRGGGFPCVCVCVRARVA